MQGQAGGHRRPGAGSCGAAGTMLGSVSSDPGSTPGLTVLRGWFQGVSLKIEGNPSISRGNPSISRGNPSIPRGNPSISRGNPGIPRSQEGIPRFPDSCPGAAQTAVWEFSRQLSGSFPDSCLRVFQTAVWGLSRELSGSCPESCLGAARTAAWELSALRFPPCSEHRRPTPRPPRTPPESSIKT